MQYLANMLTGLRPRFLFVVNMQIAGYEKQV